MTDSAPFKDAEAWLAERGVPRDPIRVAAAPEPAPTDAPTPLAPDESPTTVPPADPRPADPPLDEAGGPPPTAREAVRLAADVADDAARRDAERAATKSARAPRMDDDVTEAVAFLRRSTSVAPQSEARLRDKLNDRGTPAPVVEAAMERARRERLVDDEAMVAALVDERRRKGHAPARIRRDLRERGFGDDLLDRALAGADAEDGESAAYALARDKASRCTALEPETAFRRVAAYVARRGYPDGLARKVAREAVFTVRDDQRTAGH